MEKILVIEDNKDVNQMVKETLESEGYLVVSAFDGIQGMNLLKQGGIDLLVLDLMLPYKNGDEIVKELREFSNLPILVVSAKDMVLTKIDLIKLGADDYMTKPFNLAELTVRVQALLRRSQPSKKERILAYKDLEVHMQQKQVIVNGKEVELTAKEYQILELFLTNPKKVFSKANIYESLWGEEYLGDDNTIKAHLSNLRSKLKKANPDCDYIETVWGFGYRLMKEELSDN